MPKRYNIPETSEQFEAMMSEVFRPQLPGGDMADELGYSRSTVSRWTGGMSRPHKVIWPTITAWINDRLGRDD